ncbi:magnetosome-associated protein MamJ-like [Chironomus tepperi]|uniref:magnetosome-associated protein MamJ-like n=1 Tax=Chironomus tepperi TaxID=113505 RepID=UPI00391FB403
MKSIIIVFALIAAASCDVSHVVKGDGWYKDETGYHYTEPAVKLDEPVPEEPIVPVEEPVVVEDVPAEEPAPVVAEVVAEPEAVPEVVVAEEIVEVAAPEEPAPVVSDAVVEVNQDYLPPKNTYLPPQSAEAKKKRQAPVRKVYRRFVKKH